MRSLIPHATHIYNLFRIFLRHYFGYFLRYPYTQSHRRPIVPGIQARRKKKKNVIHQNNLYVLWGRRRPQCCGIVNVKKMKKEKRKIICFYYSIIMPTLSRFRAKCVFITFLCVSCVGQKLIFKHKARHILIDMQIYIYEARVMRST